MYHGILWVRTSVRRPLSTPDLQDMLWSWHFQLCHYSDTEFCTWYPLCPKSSLGNDLGLGLRYNMSPELWFQECCLGQCYFCHKPQEARNSARVDFIKTFITARRFSTRSEHWKETGKYSESVQNLKRHSSSSFATWALSQHVQMPLFCYWETSLGVSTQ